LLILMLIFFGRRIRRSASSSDWRPVAHLVSCLSSEYCFDLCWWRAAGSIALHLHLIVAQWRMW
jgi:hypothetical protein